MNSIKHNYTAKDVCGAIGWAALFVAILVLGQVGVTWLSLFALIGSGTEPQTALEGVKTSAMWIVTVADLLAVVIGLLIVYIRRGEMCKDTALVRTKGAKPLLQALLLGIGLCGVVSVMMATIPFPESWMDAYVESSESVAGDFTVLGLFSTVIVAPFAEELMLRGLAYRHLKRGMSGVVAALIISVVFGCIHGTIVWAFYTFIMSMVSIAILEISGSLWTSIVMHMGFNLVGQLPLLMENAPDAVVAMYYYGLSAVFVLTTVWVVKEYRRAKEAKNQTPPMPYV